MKPLFRLSLLPAILAFSGCIPGIYLPTAPYAPELRRAGDFEATAGGKLHLNGVLLAPEFNASVSPLPRVGLLGSYRREYESHYASLAGHHWNPNPYLRQELWEAGAGWYSTQKAFNAVRLRLSAYGGYTQGWLERRDDLLTQPYRKWYDDLDVRFHRLWLQGHIAFYGRQREKTTGGLGLKISRHTFDAIAPGRGIPLPEDFTPRSLLLTEGFVYVRYNLLGQQGYLQTGFGFLEDPTREPVPNIYLSTGLILGPPNRKRPPAE